MKEEKVDTEKDTRSECFLQGVKTDMYETHDKTATGSIQTRIYCFQSNKPILKIEEKK